MDKTKLLKEHIRQSYLNVLYTYVAHWNIVGRLTKYNKAFKTAQIVLAALSAGGVLTAVINEIPSLAWLGIGASSLALALNLGMLHFDFAKGISQHQMAANDLWDIRAGYKSLLVDFDDLPGNEIREKRDQLTRKVSEVNHKYSGTDEKSFKKAQKSIEKYLFEDEEAKRLLGM